MPETTEPKNPTASSDTQLEDEQVREILGSRAHLTPAEAGRLLGRSPARVREMIRFGELTQERVGNRWLIPLRDVERILSPSPKPRDHERRVAPKGQKPKPNNIGCEGKFSESTSLSSPKSMGKVLITKQTGELAAEIERLDSSMKQIDNELRVLRSGLLNDEKRERIEELKTEKRKLGKNLQELQRELSRHQR